MKTILFSASLVALVGCADMAGNLRGFAASKSRLPDGGTVLYGIVPCPYPSRDCHSLYVSGGREKAEAAAKAQAEAVMSGTCPKGWTIEESGVPGWTKLAPSTATPADSTVLVYRCKT